MKKILFSVFYCMPILAFAQAPPDYYNPTMNKTGQDLRIALHDIIKNHISISYNEVWTAFKTMDKKANGKVWDIYSDDPNATPPYEYTFTSDQCGNYNSEGDCYNREHSWPKSYFSDQTPMYTDLFHLYPTDGYVNSKRSNYPYRIVNASNPWISENGSKLGTSDPSIGYTGIVFEPIDDYKGDLARTYFYMSTRYYSEDGGWQSWAMADGAELKSWASAMLLEWNHEDPVSQKEIDRNNAIYEIQYNRNPFIDHPEFADCIWGNGNCITTGIAAGKNGLNGITIYPNPARNDISIDWQILNPEERLAVDIVNIQGKTLYHKDMQSIQKKEQVNISDYTPGIYWIKIQTQKGNSVRKIVVY